ncbi:MAG: signal peptidase I [Kofleriaceae bacterium]
MRGDEVWARVLGSFLLPGLGQALCGRRWRALAWGVLGLAAVVGVAWSIWLLYGGLAVRVLCAADTFACTRRAKPADRWQIGVTSTIGAIGIVYFLAGFEGYETPSTSMLPTLAQGDKLYVDTVSHRVRELTRGEVIVFRQPCTPARQYVKRIVALGGDTIEVRCGVVYINGKAVPAVLVAARHAYEERDETGHPSEREASVYRETIDGATFEIFDEVTRPGRLDKRPRNDYPDDVARSCADAADQDSLPSTVQPPLAIVRTKPQADACEVQAHVVVPPGTLFVLGDSRHNSNDSRYWGVVPRALVIGRAIGVWSPFGRIGDL